MLLLRLVKVDFNLIFNQGFRLLLVITSVVCYTLLVIFHVFMLRPMYKMCGKRYFSVVSRWLFYKEVDNALANTYTEITIMCYLTNMLDLTMMSFGLLFVCLFTCECCLLRRKKRQLSLLRSRRQSQLGSDVGKLSSKATVGDNKKTLTGVAEGEGKPDARILRHRLSKQSSTTRFIVRLALLLPSAFLSSIHLLCCIISYLLFHLALPSLDAEARKYNENYLSAIRWHALVYTILAIFLCGFYWSVAGINMTMLKSIYARFKRFEQFKRLNASAFTENEDTTVV